MLHSHVRLSRRGWPLAASFALLGALFWLWPARQGESENFVFYLSHSRQLVAIVNINNVRYVPLLRVLNLVGTVSDVQEKKRNLKVWFGTAELELREGDRKLKVDGQNIDLDNAIAHPGPDWLVPLDFLYSVLPRLTSQSLQYRRGDERMFVGDVRPVLFSVRMAPLANGSRLTVQFSAPAAVQTASSNGQWVLFLGDQPMLPAEAAPDLHSPYISSVRYDDQDGVAKLLITPASSALNFYPASSDRGRTFQADVTQGLPVTAAAPGAPQPAGGAPAAQSNAPAPPPNPAATATNPAATAQITPPLPTEPAPPPLPVVVLDAGHGGQDAGAHSRDGVNERDLVESLVAKTRAAVEAGGKLRVVLTRQGAGNPSADERDALTNLARPAAFVSFHAGDLGTTDAGAVVYTYRAPSPPANGDSSEALFVPWKQAQQAHLAKSLELAGKLTFELSRVDGLATRAPAAAPVRQLRSVDAPAVAVELGPLSPAQDASALDKPALIDAVAQAIARALEAMAQGGP